ncbi:E3 ubiquitin-protein ligase rififylin isoform X1 [Triplophysa dalaica]|uniref:E3 ubiquitin-protein ligase rififylin isoform X1 n=1 Tax=Triplophysa dalaica TaxID=1582913 RepID=UPI0024DF45A8|nr:E3 ubiquitin-protein ligase rififylin isoform X1 [Triplophysa dalaica]XP_056612132.1 E3 ubiquitin-protein ligase rififylin isoform X1 [Triplophysa dalaica]XP_056612133.1 E3 ubiquitin-protein ligase rififylin isoform X1 [Triplophysa dalaica]XP_056612134.1 E3 ubiquitin-protein ligase rififylin isoform X1 [Triplophysa dalaica]XP_056612135.1 E3 ubiquitin-protein ligase rififylin isoform X1 [Triplophysa dalaica]XP_056612136.1 E3 ubiquitin-protein ligase rififylin isoform X1 [Triplophysa dalaica]
MWASCCGWLCLDDSTVVETRSSTRQEAFTNSGFSSSPSPPAPESTCKACGGQFDILTMKHTCMDCKKSYCSRCSAQQDPQPWLCHTCQRCHGILFQRAELMKLKVKDLRDYLHLHEIATQMCREKEELVELVLGQHTPTSEMHIPLPTNIHLDQQQTPGVPVITASPSGNNGVTELGPQDQAPEDEQSLSVAEVTTESDMDTDLHVEQELQSSDSEEVFAPGRRASLSDLRAAEDIEDLSVRQLKEILARNFVDYKGCCEKWELMERVKRLFQDQKDLQTIISNAMEGTDTGTGMPGEENICKICMDSPIDCVLLECGHMVTCTKCGKRMNECPICRQYVVRAVHVFRS